MTGFVDRRDPADRVRRPVRVIMDPDLGRYPTVWAAAGLPTAVFGVPPATLRILANATVAPITEDRGRPMSRPSRVGEGSERARPGAATAQDRAA